MTVAELELRMGEWLASDYRAVLFGTAKNPAVGYALYRSEPEYADLRQLYVMPEFRRKGIGRSALAWLDDHVWPQAPRVRIEVLVGNAAGRAFWTAVGFREYAITLERERDATQVR